MGRTKAQLAALGRYQSGAHSQPYQYEAHEKPFARIAGLEDLEAFL